MLSALKAHFAYSRTVFVARTLTYTSVALETIDGYRCYFQGTDFQPIYARVLDFAGVPQDMRSFVITAFCGAITAFFEYLRRVTRTPIGGSDAGAPTPAS